MGFKGKSISVASYDSGNRLTAWNRAGADENHSQTWDYDDAGNWNSTTKDGDTESRNHSVSNQITQLDGKAVSHDLKGNLTDYEYDRTDYRVKYDLDNRIVEVKADSETIRYRYDALGRRIVSKGDDETVLIWWGDSECAEYEHRASQDAIQNDIMGHPTRLNSVIARDTEDRENRVEFQWYHKNYLDHVYAVSDKDGDIKEHYRYTAFGEPEIYSATGARRNTSAIGNTVMWNTRRYDADNGLYYYKYRHYAANIAGWLGRDPVEEKGGSNLYAFVGNDVVNSWDRLGLEDWQSRYNIPSSRPSPANPNREFPGNRLQLSPGVEIPGTGGGGNCIGGACGTDDYHGLDEEDLENIRRLARDVQDLSNNLESLLNGYDPSSGSMVCRRVECGAGTTSETPCEVAEREIIIAYYVKGSGQFGFHGVGREIPGLPQNVAPPFESRNDTGGNLISGITDPRSHFIQMIPMNQLLVAKRGCYCCCVGDE